MRSERRSAPTAPNTDDTPSSSHSAIAVIRKLSASAAAIRPMGAAPEGTRAGRRRAQIALVKRVNEVLEQVEQARQGCAPRRT
ncbi:hypothetical protein [Dactylosporangium sp. NPDC051484]|uniref:hypothetical protein n=1 Tax=Dactylosporangium sp. NPDC051484 TaxID=3154942 RepID=UPI00344DEAA2